MIRVVHIITKLELGGAQENTLYTCEHLDRSRFSVALLHGPDGYLDERAASAQQLDDVIVPELIRRVRPRTDVACVRALTRYLKTDLEAHVRAGGARHDYVVHTHSSKAGILGRIAAHRAGVPVIIHTIHGFGFFDGQPPLKFHSYLNAERWVARHTDAFIAVSRANLVEARARGIVDSGHRLEVIRSGFDLSAFGHVSSEASETVRRELGIEDDDEIVLCVANLKSQKDPLTLVKAAATLLRRRPRLLVLYAGDGEMRDSVERVIANHNLGDRFRLLGWRTDIPELMSIADVVALSSRYEGLPKTSVQALAARKPFVGTRVDGTPEVIRNGQNGFLVEPNAPEALADALERALDERPVDPTDEERLRDWDQDEMVRAQERLYDSMTADKRAR